MTLRGPTTAKRRILNKVNRSIEWNKDVYGMRGRKPNKEEQEYLSRVADVGCIVCLLTEEVFTPPEIHHIDGKTKKDAHFKAIPLCHYHHREGSDNEAYTSRHPYKVRFEERYGTEQYLLEKTKELI